MRLNLADIDDRGYDAIPAGKYYLTIADYEMRQVKNDGKLPAGTPMINWEFNVGRNVNTGDESCSNRKLWMNTPIHQRTLFNLKALMRASGKYTDDELVGEVDFEPDELIGSEVVGVINQREYNGNTVNDVRRVLPVSSGGTQAASLLP